MKMGIIKSCPHCGNKSYIRIINENTEHLICPKCGKDIDTIPEKKGIDILVFNSPHCGAISKRFL